MSWDISHNWLKTIERRLNELGSMVRGNQSFQSDRILDVVEQIDELRKQVDEIACKQDKMATWIKANVPRKQEPTNKH